MRSGATGTPWPVSQNSAVRAGDAHPVWMRPAYFQARSTFLDTADDRTPAGNLRKVLPRKEVIQPHLPVRLPCYDFTPIMSPTFDGFLP
jgi:hypothetical protein